MAWRRGLRRFALVWAVLQLALPPVATYADALIDRGTVESAGTHVEATSGSACRPGHPADCALCQVATRFAPACTATGHAPLGLAARAPQPVAGTSAFSAAIERTALPRAPPTA